MYIHTNINRKYLQALELDQLLSILDKTSPFDKITNVGNGPDLKLITEKYIKDKECCLKAENAEDLSSLGYNKVTCSAVAL
jgi:hypothetical protein